MAYYNIRDLIGHWVKPRSAEGKMCPHACCRNKRVHPGNMPVILPSRLLRRASDDDLAAHWDRVADDPREAEARAQILYEMGRRDELTERREAAEERRRQRWTARKMERAEAIDYAWLQAEAATNGNMLNRRGREAGISDRSLFTGPESRARRYASEELLNHWQTHPRPTEAMFQGQRTTLGAQYTPPRRKQYGVAARRR